MNTTPLSFLLDTMDVHRDVANLEQGLKVRAIDAQMRETRENTNFPWNLVKGTLRVFDDVLEYPITADHDEIAYIEKQDLDSYQEAAQMYNTSLQQFYENLNANQNVLADIWKDGTRMIGLRANQMGLASSLLSSADDKDDYTASDDASGIVSDNVTFKKGNSSVQFVITNNAGVATITIAIGLTADSNYKKKYQFAWVYLDAVPTSIEMRLRTDASNYLSKVLTTQFSGEAFKADDWNLIAYDLNEATETGTFDSSSITDEQIIFNGASTGIYRIDESNLREWQLLDKWYYSKYNVVTSASSVPDKEFFIGTGQSTTDVDTSDKLLGDPKWIDCIVWGAMERLIAEIENATLFSFVMRKKTESLAKFNKKFPTMTPLITTSRHEFNNDPLNVYFR